MAGIFAAGVVFARFRRLRDFPPSRTIAESNSNADAKHQRPTESHDVHSQGCRQLNFKDYAE
jgi:hypothetical protein